MKDHPSTSITFAGPSEMHGRVSAYDWASTPLGPIGSWPPSLRTIVKTLLASRYPMQLIWGPRLIQIYNDAFAEVLGGKHPAALGTDVRGTLAEAWDTLGPMVEEVMRSGVANWTPALRLLLERSGYREESYFSVSHAPAEDDEGRIVGMLGVCSEVTQQVLGERRLRLLRDLASKAGETRSVGQTCRDVLAVIREHPLDMPFALVYGREPDGRTLKLRGAAGMDEGGPASPTTVVLEDGEAGPWPFARAARGEVVRVDEVERHVALRCGPFDDPVRTALVMPIASAGQAAPLGVLVAGVSPNRALDESYSSFFELLVGQVSIALRNAHVYEDERKRAEALAELDRVKTAFFSNVSHEFRTPLTLMLGPVEDGLQDADEPLPPRQRQRQELVLRNGRRLSKLVNTLLDFARLEAGRMDASFEPTDLAVLTRELASNFRSAAERLGLRLTVDCPPLSEPVFVDREMWEKVVLNLLSNALKFTLEGGLTVRLREQEGRAMLEVVDTGIGIPADELPHLFDRFHRVRGAEGRSHEGTGIGLALVRELVKLHGGEVRATSTLGRGTVFTVAVPLGSAHLPAEHVRASKMSSAGEEGASSYVEEALRWSEATGGSTAATPPGDATAQAASMERTAPLGRVLLADDNADMRDYVRGVLSSLFVVEAVADGQAALESALARPPDLVLTDIMMPRLGGFGLLRALREERRTCSVPVIMLSARAGEESAIEGLEAGADDYLVKPFSARELLARTRSHLAMARLRQEVARREITEATLRESVQARDEFLALASHELKTPLAAFRLQFEMIERSLSAETRTHLGERIFKAGRQVSRIATVVETLLDVSQLSSSGELHLQREEVDVPGLAAEVLERLRDEAAQVGSSVTLDAESPLVGSYDRQRLRGVMVNLLSNALKYGQGKPVEVRIHEAGDRVRIVIVDHGIGIAPEARARVFERFERAVSGRNYGGFGLGLWVARQVVEAHGGSIAILETPGGGATLAVELPRGSGSELPAAHAES